MELANWLARELAAARAAIAKPAWGREDPASREYQRGYLAALEKVSAQLAAAAPADDPEDMLDLSAEHGE